MRSRLDGRKHTHKVTQRAKKNDTEREYECSWMMMKRANVVFVQTFRMIVSVLKSANVKCLTVYFYSIPSYWKQCFNQIFEIFSLRLRHSFVNNCSQCYSLFVSVPFRSVCECLCVNKFFLSVRLFQCILFEHSGKMCEIHMIPNLMPATTRSYFIVAGITAILNTLMPSLAVF